MKKPVKMIFLQTHGTYQNETLVLVGVTIGEAIKFAKRGRYKKDFVEWLIEVEQECKENGGLPSESGFFYYDKKKGYTTLWLNPFEDTWDFWETLIHELSHIVDFVLTEQKKMGPESEARAYHLEFLFREIRRKILR